MRATDVISKKRDNQPLTEAEIRWFIEAYTRDEAPDYQAAAFLMAVYLNGMTPDETAYLTSAMAQSGDMLDLSHITDYAVDKHSSGGVGDKTTLVVLPLVAAMGIPVAKMSGRGLGFSGGTLDKLESIPGFNVNLTPEQFTEIAQKTGLVLAGQTGDLAPADGLIYALRDVTATVSSLPLIASSIMSKKIAAGAHGIVLDVKAGCGAFMKDVESARALAEMMVQIGKNNGRDVIALISDMNQPLGVAVGNALETAEAIETLDGGGPGDFREHCLEIALYMVQLAGRGEKWTDPDAVRTALTEKLDNGAALAKFREMVAAQGGDVSVVDDPSKLPGSPVNHDFSAEQSGYIGALKADEIGIAASELGAGRLKKGDPVDHAVGLQVHVCVGDKVEAGAPLMTIHARREDQIEPCVERLRGAVAYSETPVDPLPLFYDVIR